MAENNYDWAQVIIAFLLLFILAKDASINKLGFVKRIYMLWLMQIPVRYSCV